MKNYPIPSSLRNQSITDMGGIIPTGSRIKIPNSKFLRFFTTWGSLNNNLNIDLDLSASFITKKGNVTNIAYYNQSSNYANHSADFTDCLKYEKNKPMVGEFVDIDIEKAKKEFRYLLLSNIIYSGIDNYSKVKSYTGVLSMDKRKKDKINNRIFEIDNALWKVELQGDYQSYVGFVFDLYTNEIIVIDQYYKNQMATNADSMFKNFNKMKEKFLNVLDIKMYCLQNNIEISNKLSSNISSIFSTLF